MAGFFGGALVLDADIMITTLGDNNDIPLNGSLVDVVVSNAGDAITGIDAGDGAQGFLILVVNTGAFSNDLIIRNNSSASIAQNRILTEHDMDLVLEPFETAAIGYDTINHIWHVIDFVGENNAFSYTTSGSTSVAIKEGWFTSFAAKSVGSETIDIGTTPGGTEIISAMSINSVTYTSLNVGMYFDSPTTIYITGAVGTVTYQFLVS